MDLPLAPILGPTIGAYIGQTLTPEVAARLASEILIHCYPGPVDTSAIAPQRVGSYVIECVTARDALKSLCALHAAHWQETEEHRHSIEMNPDYDRVINLEQQGRYLLIVARTATGEPVGNYGIYLARSVHTQTPMATEDTLFVAKAHRRGRLGIALIRYAEAALVQLGVYELNVTVKRVNNVGPMIERMGYLPVGTQYTKILKEPAHVLT